VKLFRLLCLLSSILVLTILSCVTVEKAGLFGERYGRAFINKSKLTYIDNWDELYEAEEVTLADMWFPISDADEDVMSKTSIINSLDMEDYPKRMDGGASFASMHVTYSIQSGGYGELVHELGGAQDWSQTKGMSFWMKANKPGVLIVFSCIMNDSTQTKSDSRGQTPFEFRYTTTTEDTRGWHNVIADWDSFVKAEWVGKGGTTILDLSQIVSINISFESDTAGEFWIDNIALLGRVVKEEEYIPPVKVNQIGYLIGARKTVVYSIPLPNYRYSEKLLESDWGAPDAPESLRFYILKGNRDVYRGEMIYKGIDIDAGDWVWQGDFSDFDERGEYTIEVEGVEEKSFPFEIGSDLFREPVILTARTFYLQRSGTAVHDKQISGVDYEAGHLDDGYLWDCGFKTVAAECYEIEGKKKIKSVGGWYDAGDYGKYIPPGAASVSMMLFAYQFNPDKFFDKESRIPESGNRVPDLLDEVRWELEWMLTMQFEGGDVSHKLTSPKYVTGWPVEDSSARFLFPSSTAATAAFAGVMAQAYTVYDKYDKEFAQQCLDAAEKAWSYLQRNPKQLPSADETGSDRPGFLNPPNCEGGPYGFGESYGYDTGNRLYAAVELYSATRSAQYHSYVKSHWKDSNGDIWDDMYGMDADQSKTIHDLSWGDFFLAGMFGYLLLDPADQDSGVLRNYKGQMKLECDYLLSAVESEGYRNTCVNESRSEPGSLGYYWGSMSLMMSRTAYLAIAGRIFGDKKYTDAALDGINYLFGVNPLGQCYYTGIGDKPIKHQHAEFTILLGYSVPGHIGEGPNGSYDKGGAGGDLTLVGLWAAGIAPEKCYKDVFGSWATNEPTIDANASWLLAGSFFIE